MSPSERGDALVEHYQKTYELTFELWQQRNRIFLLLLAVIGVATLLTFEVPQANSLLVDFLAALASVQDEARIDELRDGFPFGLLQAIILMVVFYLMVNLYHRAAYVLRNYRYLAELEREIRAELALDPEAVAFSRESSFYWRDRDQSKLSGLVKWAYIGLLGLLLVVFLGGRIAGDLGDGNLWLVTADLAIAVPTLLFYLEYARSSVSWDTEEWVTGARDGD